MVFDSGIKNLISAAYLRSCDVFLKMYPPPLSELSFDGVKTVVFLPCGFGGFRHSPFCDIRDAAFAEDGFADDVTVADIRLMAVEEFRKLLFRKRVARFVIPFAELGDECEYGYKEGYAWIGEYKAQTASFCQTVAFLSPSCKEIEKLQQLYSCGEVICVGNQSSDGFKILRCETVREKYFYTVKQAEKNAGEKVCIFFNSRGELKDFSKSVFAGGRRLFIYDGSLSSEEKRNILDGFYSCKNGILLATKSLIADGVYRHFSRCILCGVPFSVTHLERIASCAPYLPPMIIYTDSDFERNSKISSSLAVVLDNENIINERHRCLSEIKNLIEMRYTK